MFVLIVIVCLFLAHAVWGIFWKYQGSISDERQLQSKLATLNDEQTRLASSTEELASPGGVEYTLQEKFGAVKPGEKEIVIIDDVPTTTVTAPVQQGFFSRVWSWVTSL